MASGMYTYGIQEILRGNVDLVNDSVSAVLVSSDYSPSLTGDQYQVSIPDAALIDEVELESKALDDTAFTADPATFGNVAEGEVATAVVIIKDTGNTGTSVLLAYLEITPVTTDGTDVVVSWNADGIFEL